MTHTYTRRKKDHLLKIVRVVRAHLELKYHYNYICRCDFKNCVMLRTFDFVNEIKYSFTKILVRKNMFV
jgi:hypothetical protein